MKAPLCCILALGTFGGCSQAVADTNTLQVIQTPSGALVVSNGVVVSTPIVLNTVNVPRPIQPYHQPGWGQIHSNIVINATNKPTAAYVNRFNNLRPDYHMDETGRISKVASTNAPIKKP